MGSAASTVVHHAQSTRKTKTLLVQYGDAKGEVQEAFKSMKVSRAMRLSWLQLWQSMDEDSSNLLDYQEFVAGCGLKDGLWSRRVFNLLDKNFTGCVNFLTFLKCIPRLLVYDRSNAMEVAFRMCTRRGATCEPKNAVLDEKDIRIIVGHRYPKLDRRHAGRRAVGILAHLDGDCSGGISFEEFEQFYNVNPVFLTAVQSTLKSMRHALFGEQFWKDFTIRARTFDESTRREIFCSQREDTVREASRDNPGKPAAVWSAARSKTHTGHMKATGTAVQALHRMQVLATPKEGKYLEPSLSTASLGRLLSSLPHQLLLNEAETTRTPGRNDTTAAKISGSRALQTLKRATRVVAIARNARDVVVQRPRSKREIGYVSDSGVLSSGGGETESGSSMDEAVLVHEESLICIEAPRETPTVAESKARVLRGNGRQPWVVTEQFYAHLATAAARLDAKKTPEKGYDFSADFPKLWCEHRMHGNLGDPDTLSRRQCKLSASRMTAATYLRFIALWQESRPGRSKLDKAFSRWRLHTCGVAVDKLGVSTSSKRVRDLASKGIVHDADVSAPRQTQSVKEIWEADSGVPREQNLHDIIMMKTRADRPLPWELCEAYETEMVERVNRRQVENNVPILSMPFC